MENYIEKINNKILTKCSLEQARKIKRIYLIVGGTFLTVGLLGFIGCFIAFFLLFFKFETDTAMIYWFIAIPFILLIITGSVITRIGDMLLTTKGQASLQKAILKREIKEKEKKLKKVDHLNKKITKIKSRQLKNKKGDYNE